MRSEEFCSRILIKNNNTHLSKKKLLSLGNFVFDLGKLMELHGEGGTSKTVITEPGQI